MSADQKQQLFHNTKAAMDGVPVEIVKRWVAHCYKADPEYGKGLAAIMGLSASDIPSAVAAE
jgi:catalase